MHPLSQEKVNISPDENMVVIYLFFGAVRRFLLSLETWGGGTQRCHFCLKTLLPDLKMRHGKSERKWLRMTNGNGEGRMWNCI